MIAALLSELRPGAPSGAAFVTVEGARIASEERLPWHGSVRLALDVAWTRRDEPNASTLWTLTCTDVASWRLSAEGPPANHDLVRLDASHPALRRHTDPEAHLYFRAPASPSVGEALAALWLAHERIAGHWIPLDEVLGDARSVEAAFHGRFGLLARGPRFLIDAYAAAIQSLGCGPSVVATEEPAYEARGADGLPLFGFAWGRNFVVSEGLRVERRAGTGPPHPSLRAANADFATLIQPAISRSPPTGVTGPSSARGPTPRESA